MERIKLNLIPSGVAPIVHLSQYDDGRKFGIDLFEGESVYVLDGTETLTVNSRKPDGHVVVLTVTNKGTSSLDVDTVEQLTAVHGVSYAKLQIVKGSVTIATLPFLIDVSRDPLENGDPSESFIQNLRTQIAEGVAEEVATQYDSANVIFDTEPTDTHGIGYTVTSEGIKTAIDNAFDYDNTASGSIVHIEDGADNIPVKSLVSEIVAVESGSGEKSPTNPYSISGFDSGVVTVCGVNVWDEQWELGGYNTTTGEKTTATNRIRNKNYISVVSGETYFFAAPEDIRVFYYDINKSFITSVSVSANHTITIPSGVHFINFQGATAYGTTYNNDISINYPSTDISYHAYNGNTYTFAFGQTVFGGRFDNKGNLVVTHIIIDMGLIDWNYLTVYDYHVFGHQFSDKAQNSNEMCSCYKVTQKPRQNLLNYELGTYNLTNALNYVVVRDDDFTDATAFKTAMNGQKLVYELANPIVLSITSQDIPTLLGENNIFSNCGDVEVTYYTNKANDILEFVDSEIGKKNGTNIPIEANSQDSIKDYINNGLSGKADTSDLNDKQNKNVLNIVKHYDSGTSSDAIADIITEYGKVNMVFAFDVPLGYFTGCLTFANDNMGSGFIVLSTTGRFWVVSYVSGTITLTELT